MLSHDLKNDPDIVAMIGASAALTISGIPFMGPVGGARVGYVDGKYVLNPYMEDVTDSALDLVLAGTREGVLMVESEAKELPEETMLGAVTFGHEHMQPVIQAIIQLAEMCAKEPFTLTPEPEAVAVVKGKFEAFAGELAEAYKNPIKQERYAAVDAVKEKAVESLGESEDEVASAVDENEDVSVVEMGWGGVSESLRERCGESVADEELERRPGLEDTADWE